MKTLKCDFPNEKVGLRIHNHEKPSLLHTHNFDEITIVLKGSGIHKIGMNHHPIMRGDVFVVQGNQSHKFIKTKNLKIAIIVYEREYFQEIKKEFKDVPGFSALFLYEPIFREKQKYNAFLRLSSSQFLTIEDLLARLDKEQNEREAGFMLALKSVFTQIIVNLCRYYHKTDSNKVKGILKISSAIDYMENHFAEKITIESLCEILDMQQTTFRRIFKKVTGSSPIDFLIHFRIEKAAEMMRQNPNLHIIDICLNIGLENSGYFGKKFKEIIGMTPIEYLKKQRN